MTHPTAAHDRVPARRRKIDRALLIGAMTLAGVTLLDPGGLSWVAGFALKAFATTLPFIAIAVLAVGTIRASGAERMIARAFEGRETRMIVAAALVGGIAPFCSCQVIPFIAAMLAMGAPLSAVMAFWLSSPIMDPAMFLITAGNLGLPFAVAKTIAAVGMGLLGGFTLKALAPLGLFADPLRADAPSRGCGAMARYSGKPQWRFWQVPERTAIFRDAVAENALFLGKWLMVAYLIEAVMVRHVPAEWIAGTLGGDGIGPVFLGALVGGPAYLNGYAAVPLVAGLLEQGMSQGAAMAFVLAGGVSCIPAALAVWALVRPKVFAAYLGLAFVGSVLAGLAWAAIA